MRGPGSYLLLLVVIFLLVTVLQGPVEDTREVPYSQFIKMVEKGELSDIHVIEKVAYGLKKDTTFAKKDFPKKFDVSVNLPSVDSFMADMKSLVGTNPQDKGISLTFEPPAEPGFLITFLPYALLIVIMIAFWWYMLRAQGQGNNRVMNFGRSRAKINTDTRNRKTFADVAGADEEKEELAEIVDFLKDPRKYTELGARIPKGVLLVGPPGTGKTLLAKAVAGEAGVPFYSISGSDFVEMFVGVGASRVRDLFDTAKKNAPCILFIDEIDAVGRQRGAGLGGGHDEREQTLNQLLVEMDGFTENEGIIVLAATNRPDILDPALLRPGRFDRRVTVNFPDIKGREEIFKVHTKAKPLAEDVDLKVLSRRTPWFTGADIENVANEAAILSARRGHARINMQEMLEAITRVQMGPEKKSAVVTENDKVVVAYHETGHAMVAHFLKNCDPVHEVSVIPRGQAGGYTMTLPSEETHYASRSRMIDDIAMSLGGRAAEEIMLGEITSGSSSDLKRATTLARRMVVEFGMSDKIGTIYYGSEHEVFLGRDYGQTRAYSESIATNIDEEVRLIIERAFNSAKSIIEANRDKMKLVAEKLIEVEKLDNEAFVAVVGPRPFDDGGKEAKMIIAPPNTVEPPKRKRQAGLTGRPRLEAPLTEES
jgi:cell division protease FtsH